VTRHLEPAPDTEPLAATWQSRQRLECGDFSTAFVRAKVLVRSLVRPTQESGGAPPPSRTLRAHGAKVARASVLKRADGPQWQLCLRKATGGSAVSGYRKMD
jgi:hypothetical protein